MNDMIQFELTFTPYFKKKYQKLIKKNIQLKDRFVKVLSLLQINPFTPQLRTHKVNSRIKNSMFSSSITGDLRIIWEFNETEAHVIDILDTGGHEGSGSVY
jgi:mRNA-degrading endonuclease YafQ of YafQ-DinJ toxin-antitoxin module